MRPEGNAPSSIAVLLGSLLLLVAAIGGPATAAPAASAPAQSADYAQTQADTPDADNETAAEILDSYERQLSSVETISLTVVSNSSSASYSSSAEQSIWVDFEENRLRTESTTDYGETITVRNESGTVVYNVDDNTVSEYEYAFDGQYSTPLSLDTLVNDSDFMYEGVETIDGPETYRLDIAPQMQYGNHSYQTTVWVATETYLPVQSRTTSDSGQYSYEVTQEYRNVTVNEPIPEERFTIDVPDDAEEPDTSTPAFFSYESESELRANTTQSVPEPDVPGNYSFENGYVTESDDYTSVTLGYATDGEESLTVSKRTTSSAYSYDDNDNYDAVDVGNQTGYYNELDYGESTISILVWECAGDHYTVYGSLSESETIDVAESIDCE